MISKKLLCLIEQNKKEQILNLDSFLVDEEKKWNDDIYYYDVEEAKKIYKYISLLKNDKGTSRKFDILKFQFEIISEILCVKNKKTNLRRFKEAHINIARKNSKTFLIVIILSYLFFFQKNIFNALFVLTANTTKQATEIYNTFKNFVCCNKALKKRCKITDSKKEIIRKDNQNKLIVLSNDGSGADSYAVYSACLDEIHEYKNSDIYSKLKTGTGIWEEPLIITITTASSGEDTTNLEYQLYNVAKKLDLKEGQDETFYYKIYEADKKCDIFDFKNWIKANPALGAFRQVQDIWDMANRIKLMPLQENMFRRLFLNQHIATNNIKNAINMELWNKALRNIDIKDFTKYKCWAGLDLSSKNDITAFVVVFYNNDDNKYYVFPYLFTAKDTLVERENKDKNPYMNWVKQGELISLEGRYVKFNDVLEKMLDINDNYKLEQIGFDRWGSQTILNVLENQFNEVVGLGQGTGTMTNFINNFENLLIDERIIIQNNSCFSFMAQNCIAIYNENMECKYSKKRSKFKIDGIIAMLMGLGLAIEENETEQYNVVDALKKLNW